MNWELLTQTGAAVRAELVPGSHKTFRTEREKEAMLHYNGLGEGKKFGLTKESPL